LPGGAPRAAMLSIMMLILAYNFSREVIDERN
jgi:hypothetical protein